jgi:hypothetical protein
MATFTCETSGGERDGIGPGRHDLHAAFGVPENWESAVQ